MTSDGLSEKGGEIVSYKNVSRKDDDDVLLKYRAKVLETDDGSGSSFLRILAFLLIAGALVAVAYFVLVGS